MTHEVRAISKWEEAVKAAPDIHSIVVTYERFKFYKNDGSFMWRQKVVGRAIMDIDGKTLYSERYDGFVAA